ncbi:cobalt-precorrin 5A acetaldehyde-lyase [Lachnospiraceae bacterium]|nr:cobalt-precorrin 5A acetaldehyde-lyase [Lachnospiraceae bacterium]
MTKISTISFTENGDKLNKAIAERLTGKADISVSLKGARTEGLAEWTAREFKTADALIFIGAAGIAVRAIAPFIERKDKDPAVIVCDELGRYVIPVLSGHIGGANELASRLAELIHAEPVITTATDINNIWAVDTWAVKHGYAIENIEAIRYVSSALLRHEKVGIKSDMHDGISEIFNGEEIPAGLVYGDTEAEAGISISPYIKDTWSHTLHLIPKCLVIGAGSRKGAESGNLEKLIERIFKENALSLKAVSDIATIDIKKDETAIIDLAEKLEVPLKIYSAEELNALPDRFSFDESEFVRKTTGTDNVCERSAVKCALERGSGQDAEIIINKTKGDAVTAALARYR